MFEDSLLDSGGRFKTNSRYFTVVGVLLNSSILATMILIPLIYPEALPKLAMEILLIAPPPPPQAPPPVQRQIAQRAATVSELLGASVVAPSRIPPHASIITAEAPLAPLGVPGMGDAGDDGVKAMTNILAEVSPKPAVHQAAIRKVVSSGVMRGNLVVNTAPIYPAIAKAAHISGTVALQATISKTGAIENLHVINGPQMLHQAAIEAVRTWKYKPYLLNGEPVEVETEINVIFNLGG